MIDFDKELESILADDPLGLLDVQPKRSSAMTADARLLASFEEINAFVRDKGHEPTASRDISERKLFSRLKGLRESPEKAAALLEHDVLNLLADVAIPEVKEISTIEDVLDDDVLGLLDGGATCESDPNDIFALRNVPKATSTPDHVAKRKSCDEFEQFEPLFKQCQSDLATRKRVQVPFKSERQIRPKTMFVLQGMLCYVAGKGSWKKKGYGNFDARLYCVFENGTESNMLLRSLASALWKDENGRQVINSDQRELFDEASKIEEDDEVTGYIYVLRSLSNDPKIQEIENLYKIGFSSQSVSERISNAEKEPTYLMAEVAPVVEFQTFNLNPQKLELLLHTFFAAACLNLDVFDSDGKRHTPREWFIAPLHIIETAVELLINGEIVNYSYDEQKQEITERK